jgi:predicted HAD superfamily phosphohydrolase YqeG
MPDSKEFEATKSDQYMSELERSASVRSIDNVNDIAQAATQGTGDRAVVLMDLDNGLVGWESADDPENPQ